MLNARGPLVTAEEWKMFLAHLALLELRDAYVVVAGSLPRGVPADAYEQIVRLVQGRGARAVLDSDGPCFKAGLRADPFAIKPNVNELRRLTGRPLGTEREMMHAASELNRGGVEIVMVSRGRHGLLVVSREGSYRAVPPPVRVKSTVGAGDSMVAGFVFRQAGGKGLEDCVRFATAAGTAATLAPGNQLCRLTDVQRLTPRIKIQAIGDGR
jgi:1-phosphofructokinase family hexose kinase